MMDEPEYCLRCGGYGHTSDACKRPIMRRIPAVPAAVVALGLGLVQAWGFLGGKTNWRPRKQVAFTFAQSGSVPMAAQRKASVRRYTGTHHAKRRTIGPEVMRAGVIAEN